MQQACILTINISNSILEVNNITLGINNRVFAIMVYNFATITHRLEYDPSDNTFHDNREVHVKVPGFGDTSSVEYLSPGLIDTFEYFHKTVEYFVDRGYKRGETIRAAPYDWRLAAGTNAWCSSISGKGFPHEKAKHGCRYLARNYT